MYKKIEEIEKKLAYTQDLFGGLRHKKMNEKANFPANFGINYGDIECNTKDIEYTVMDQVNQKMDLHFENLQKFEDKVEKYNEKLARDMAIDIKTLESRMSEFIKKIEEVIILCYEN